MRCQRCGADTRVRSHRVDEFTGYLCDGCRERWDELVAPAPGTSP